MICIIHTKIAAWIKLATLLLKTTSGQNEIKHISENNQRHFNKRNDNSAKFISVVTATIGLILPGAQTGKASINLQITVVLCEACKKLHN